MASQLTFTGFAWKNLWRRRLRTLLTLCGISMAIGAFVALVGFSRSFEHEWLRLYSSSGTDIAVVEKNFLNTSVNQNLTEKLRAVPVVSSAGADIAVVEKTFLNASFNQNLTEKRRAVPVVQSAEPMIFNLMDLTPEVNAIVFGWLDDSYGFGSLKIGRGHV